ncbi:probable beta-1,4-xylosyltransferase IRX14H [Juglans microcarpa x Juglans regia]|uniref:probable beta-1,4-xylosyltransferase IRX14H n=1 Tax=Juglans microcarpa x Juglans regia TaxID=2249226 RepID=UPI001B7ECEEF|nr:probable beta-1,4-xylosyltransferase IRX14H [Juglans microcarpa x Juglans regia]
MKLSVLQQSYMNRRGNSFRSSGPLDSSSDASIKSPSSIIWLLFHGLCCLISLVLGFRFSRLVFFFLFSTSHTTNLYNFPFRTASELAQSLTVYSTPITNFNSPLGSNATTTGGSNSRVVVGRHGIRIRPWPHPNPVEVMRAHHIIETVQKEQRLQFGVKNPRTVIVITPTYVRTFQALHLTGVMHSLMLVPYDLVWIVVEAGGATNETASLIAKSRLRTIHVGFRQRMPILWEGRHHLEVQMRLQALRIVRDKKLDGIVMFADDSNTHSMELFDEIQNVKWVGALSVGILAHSSDTDESSVSLLEKDEDEDDENPSMPVQGPACNSSNQLVGWHTFNSIPYVGNSATYIGDRGVVLPRKLEWAGFVLNSRLLWKDDDGGPEWVNDLDTLAHNEEAIESPLFLLKDFSVVEPLGSCGRQILLWWLRVEARADSKFPPGWIIDPPLEVTVPSKRTPWPDVPPELPSSEREVTGVQEHIVKHSSKTRTSRSNRSRSKRKYHDTKILDTQLPVMDSEQS